MRKYLWLIPAFLLITGCSSSKRLLQTQNYDEAISKSVKKLVRNPTDQDEINILKQAYRLANTVDTDRINFLKQSEQPDIWEEMYQIFSGMKNRQSDVERLQPSVLTKIKFQKLDYNNAIISSKQKAADYLYAFGNSLLSKNDKFAAREAYTIFNRVKTYYPQYKNIDDKIADAHFVGTSQVLFGIENNTELVIPKRFEQEMLNISPAGLNSKWLNYSAVRKKDFFYDYVITLHFNRIDISPDLLKERNYTDSKSVRDGWRYELDSNGNVKKDEKGNDIKTPKYKMIKCVVTEYKMTKRTNIRGTIEFYDNVRKQIIKKEPVITESVFDHIYARSKGDNNALSADSRKILKNKPLPFPSDVDMIYQTQENLKRISKQILRRHKKLLEK